MMVVVADTSPINYLVLIGCIDPLRDLYGQIVIPEEVLDELVNAGAPPLVRFWAEARPTWIDVRSVSAASPISAEIANLDGGERAAQPGDAWAQRVSGTATRGAGRAVEARGRLGRIERA